MIPASSSRCIASAGKGDGGDVVGLGQLGEPARGVARRCLEVVQGLALLDQAVEQFEEQVFDLLIGNRLLDARRCRHWVTNTPLR